MFPRFTSTLIKSGSSSFKKLFNIFNGSSIKGFDKIYQLKSCDIYKINEDTKQNSKVNHKNKLLLWHGTGSKNFEGILKEGFLNSKYGWFGGGKVYLTESSDKAISYSYRKNLYSKSEKNYIFLAEICTEHALTTEKFHTHGKQKYPVQHPFTRFAHIRSPKFNLSKNFGIDEKKRLYRKTQVNKWSSADEFLIDASDVKPRFLFVLETVENKKQYNKYREFYLKCLAKK